MTELPAVSVIVPTFNRPNELRRLLTALARQEGASFEVVIVDDGGSIPWTAFVGNSQLRCRYG